MIPFNHPYALKDWVLKHQEAIALPAQAARYDRLFAGQRYIYQQDQRRLMVELRDVRATQGDVGLLHTKYLDSRFATDIQEHQFQRHTTKAGSYYLARRAEELELQTCLHNSQMAITSSEFQQRAYYEAFQPQRLMRWLLGQQSLLNDRCLWIRATVQASEKDTALALLEELSSNLKSQ